MIYTAIIALIISMALLLLRTIKSSNSYDRILAVNAFGSVVIATTLVIAYTTKMPMFLDVAITYALINFVATVALLAFVRQGNLNGS